MPVSKVHLYQSPHQFNEVQIRIYCRTFPPVHSVVSEEPLDVSAGVFEIIVLIEPVGGGKPLCNEWHKGGRWYVSILCGIHYATEHDKLSGSLF